MFRRSHAFLLSPLKVKVVACTAGGKKAYTTQYPVGSNLMECVRDDGASPVDMQGICCGTLECSTCHIYLEGPWFDKVAEVCPVSEREEDLLDETLEFRENASRLACQVVLSEEMEGLEFSAPRTTRDARWKKVLERAKKSKEKE